MRKKLSIYFIHSQKDNFNEKLYLPVLRSDLLSFHNLIFPTSEKNKNKYYKDLMDTATLFVVDLTNADQGVNMELKQAIMSKKPILALADNSIGYEEKYTKLVKNVIGYSTESDVRYFVETFAKNYETKVNDKNEVDNSVVLGVLH